MMSRTPVRMRQEMNTVSPKEQQNVHHSIGEERKPEAKTQSSPEEEARVLLTKLMTTIPITSSPITVKTPSLESKAELSRSLLEKDRISEARACLIKSKAHLKEARNLKTDIRVEVTRGLEKLYQLVKDAESDRKKKEQQEENSIPELHNAKPNEKERENIIISKIEENKKLLEETNRKIEDLRKEMEKHAEITSNTTVDREAASPPIRTTERTALHSIIISSKDDEDTGDAVLDSVREAINAKEGWVKVERVRKAKDRKIVVGCRTVEERNKIKDRIEQKAGHLVVEEARNKDPLFIARDVMLYNNDDDILKAIKNQNRDLFHDLDDTEVKIQIKYKKKARNPHAQHIVFSAPPAFWKRAVEAGVLHIDLQRVKIMDQSPLVQCSRCLEYGHSRRYCKDTSDICSHCGGPHLSIKCTDRLAGLPPKCKNCERAKLTNVVHNTFDNECPVRRKWDDIARATVAYC